MNKHDNLTDDFKYYEFWSSAIVNGRLIKHHTEPPFFERILTMACELQKVRDYIGKPIRINSAYRTLEYNRYIKSGDGSYHVKCMAVDTRPIGYPLFNYYSALLKLTVFNGYGYYRWRQFIHSDLRKDFVIFKY